MPKVFSDSDFIDAWNRLKSPSKVAKFLKIPLRNVYSRRRNLERKHNIVLSSAIETTCKSGDKFKIGQAMNKVAQERARKYETEMHIGIKNGSVVVGSDAHYWPGIVTAAHEGFCRVIKAIKPQAVVLNGDILDGARISRHSRIMWEKQPELHEEIKAVQDRCAEIERAANGAQLIRTIGNHDARFENYLSSNAPDFEEMSGSTLIDYLPRWRSGWAIHVNAGTDGWTVIRHRPVNGGIHAAYNSTLRAGTHYVHGHLHKLQYTPWADYRGRRYGIDTGSMAEAKGPQFMYTEAAPLNWASGFVVLTFVDGLLMEPEIAVVQHGKCWFRGAAI